MTDWRLPPENEERDLAPLLAKRERLEGHALRVVGDGEGDPGFSLLGLIVKWLWVLQGRIVAVERFNRRLAQKAEMLGSEALRMNMCDRLGGVEALERWEERAQLALSLSSQVDGSRLRGNDEGGGLGSQHCRAGSSATSDRRSDVPFGTAPSPTRTRGSPSGVPEFALARMPGRVVRRVTTRIVRAAPRYETPIPIWPCEIMPERFKWEWWKAAPSETDGGVRGKASCTGAGYSTLKEHGADDGGPASRARACVVPGLV